MNILDNIIELIEEKRIYMGPVACIDLYLYYKYVLLTIPSEYIDVSYLIGNSFYFNIKNSIQELENSFLIFDDRQLKINLSQKFVLKVRINHSSFPDCFIYTCYSDEGCAFQGKLNYNGIQYISNKLIEKLSEYSELERIIYGIDLRSIKCE